jgi:hypothetical protein
VSALGWTSVSVHVDPPDRETGRIDVEAPTQTWPRPMLIVGPVRFEVGRHDLAAAWFRDLAAAAERTAALYDAGGATGGAS